MDLLFMPLQGQLLILVLVFWELVWKGIALWIAARNGHKVMYLSLLIINTVGILPIGYIVYNKYFKK